MTDLQALINAVDELKQLYTHLLETRIKFEDIPQSQNSAPRILGLFEHVGETWMSDDFNAELPASI